MDEDKSPAYTPPVSMSFVNEEQWKMLILRALLSIDKHLVELADAVRQAHAQ